MINLKDLPEETKFISDDSCVWNCKQDMLEDQSNDRCDVFTAVPVAQEITLSWIRDLYNDMEENNGYDGQGEDCYNELSEDDKATLLDILNKPFKKHIAYTNDEEVDPASIDEAIKEMRK